MRIAGSIITAICGIVIIVSIFLNWTDWGTAWNYIDASVGDVFYLLAVLIGGILMTVFGISAFIVSLATKGGRAAVITLALLAMVGALLAIGGSAWFLVDIMIDLWEQMGADVFSVISYGVWIAIAAAVIGFIFAILTASFSKGREDYR